MKKKNHTQRPPPPPRPSNLLQIVTTVIVVGNQRQSPFVNFSVCLIHYANPQHMKARQMEQDICRENRNTKKKQKRKKRKSKRLFSKRSPPLRQTFKLEMLGRGGKGAFCTAWLVGPAEREKIDRQSSIFLLRWALNTWSTFLVQDPAWCFVINSLPLH